jgi:hypothetical protein
VTVPARRPEGGGEAGLVKFGRQEIIAQGHGRRFLNELKKELKG